MNSLGQRTGEHESENSMRQMLRYLAVYPVIPKDFSFLQHQTVRPMGGFRRIS